MLRTTARILLALIIAAATYACSKVPSHVIPPDDMAELVADLNVGEAVVEMNYQDYATDSSRRALKQAILLKHHVTRQDLDTSLMWYGAHIDMYNDVYKDAEQILQERLDHSNAVATELARMSVSGDSVDVWTQPHTLAFGPRSARRFLRFDLKGDRNTKPGDSYTWRIKMFNLTGMAYFDLAAGYTDGTVETLTSQFSGDGWQSITFYTDSTRTLKSIYGTLELPVPFEGSLYLDSIQLVRNRLNRMTYVQRYRQRLYDFRSKADD